eukprot:793737-Pelagomonas_calceolata.AAC.3
MKSLTQPGSLPSSMTYALCPQQHYGFPSHAYLNGIVISLCCFTAANWAEGLDALQSCSTFEAAVSLHADMTAMSFTSGGMRHNTIGLHTVSLHADKHDTNDFIQWQYVHNTISVSCTQTKRVLSMAACFSDTFCPHT